MAPKPTAADSASDPATESPAEPSRETRPRHKPRGRVLRWLVPALLVLAWLGLAGVGGPYTGKLGDVAENDDAAFLPESAESTTVSELARRFNAEERVPAIVVAERPGGLEPADVEYVTGQLTRFAEPANIPPQALAPAESEDGEALRVIVPIDATNPVDEVVTDLRSALADAPDGLEVHVTGPAGQITDLGEAFSGIDGLLLLVAGSVVALILVAVYRSPILPVLVLVSAVSGLGLASLVVHWLADANVVTLNGQSQGIMFILVVGAATDYALLLVARLREELRRHDDRVIAIWQAWRSTLGPILASAGTVIAGLLCLLVSGLLSNQSLGPVAAIGIASALLAAMTFLPALLALLGRTAFWPFRPPAPSATGPAEESDSTNGKGIWQRLSAMIDRAPRLVWIVTTVVLLGMAAFLPQLKASGTSQTDIFLNPVDSVAGQEVLDDHFPGGTGSPTIVIARADRIDRVQEVAESVDGVSSVAPVAAGQRNQPQVVDGLTQLEVVLDAPPDSDSAIETVAALRDRLGDIDGADARVGGPTAIQLDTREIAERDRTLIIPLILAIVLVVLMILLRALVAPILLLATVVLSFAATMGVSALVFNHILGFPGADPTVPLFGFVFLVALGIDYNIFLMTRVREETTRHGTREGTLRGLQLTGGVITSAGVVLAATFAALAVLPILFLAQIAFIVAFGVLLDTLIVRSLLVPALGVDVDRRIWWPAKLSRPEPAPAERS